MFYFIIDISQYLLFMNTGLTYGYTIIYVENVKETLEFYKKAFGFEIKLTWEDSYGELNTGSTTIGFAAYKMADELFTKDKYQRQEKKGKPLGFELAFVTENVKEAYDKAVSAGVEEILKPVEKPWGQTVSYVRAIDGTIVEICSPVK